MDRYPEGKEEPLAESQAIFAGEVAVLTGAASGIGRALAIRLSDAGCAVALVDVNGDALEETADIIRTGGGRCSCHCVDLGDATQIAALYREVEEQYGRCTMLINNAGVCVFSSVEDLSYDDLEWIMRINFQAPVTMIKTFLPLLKQAPGARIINVSSIFGVIAAPRYCAYNASKFALRGFTESLAMACNAAGILVQTVIPGNVKTGIAGQTRFTDSSTGKMSADDIAMVYATHRGLTPDEAARRFFNGLVKRRRRILIGRDARFLDWVSRHFPAAYQNFKGA